MKTMEKKPKVKMNLSLEREFYELLRDHAESDYVKVATWTKQFLMKNLSGGHKTDTKCVISNGTEMED
jgi:hypothetical protein